VTTQSDHPTPFRPDDLVDAALRASAGGRLVVLIDGRSGAGKTTLARDLADRLSERLGLPVGFVSLDDCYPGWHGLAAASLAVTETILRPVDPGYRRYDWTLGRAAEWVSLPPTGPLIVEGAGCLTPESALLADLHVWVDANEAARRHLAIHRDGATYESWWDVWAEQELAHIARNHPDELADVRVDPIQGLAWW